MTSLDNYILTSIDLIYSVTKAETRYSMEVIKRLEMKGL
jgi:hypothetical protein